MIEENRFFIDYEQIKLTENDWKTLAHQIDQLEFFNLKSTRLKNRPPNKYHLDLRRVQIESVPYGATDV